MEKPAVTPPPPAPASPLFPEDAVGTTERTGEAIDNGRGRIFPCRRCGADLEFSIGQQSLQCPYCGSMEESSRPKSASSANATWKRCSPG